MKKFLAALLAVVVVFAFADTGFANRRTSGPRGGGARDGGRFSNRAVENHRIFNADVDGAGDVLLDEDGNPIVPEPSEVVDNTNTGRGNGRGEWRETCQTKIKRQFKA